MNIEIVKTWTTGQTIEAPDGLSREELRQWIADNIDSAANDSPAWDSSIATVEGEIEPIVEI
jgi:hypothetical protein